jgi:hypothetical protein
MPFMDDNVLIIHYWGSQAGRGVRGILSEMDFPLKFTTRLLQGKYSYSATPANLTIGVQLNLSTFPSSP